MASSPVELPSSDDASAGSAPDLTDSDGVVPALAGQCCSRGCLAPFETDTQLRDTIDLWRQWLGGVSHEQHLDHVFQLLRDLNTMSTMPRQVTYRFLGQSVCRKAWSSLVQVSCGWIWKMQKNVRAGFAERPQDGRSFNGKNLSDGNRSVDAFLRETFDSVAEWMPHTSSDAAALAAPVAPAAPTLSEWLASPSTGPSATTVTAGRSGVRYLAHQSLQDLFYTYQSQMGSEQPASYTTFLRVFRDWRRVLVFLKPGDHSKCPDCEHFKELNRRSTARSDQDTILKAYRQHLAAQYADRAVAARLSLRGRASVHGDLPLDESLLVLCMDGMDQAKFRAPRNTSQSKDLTGRQRPHLHCVGAIIDGVSDFYYFNDLRVSKDANLQITLLARTIGVAVDIVETSRLGAQVPAHLVVHSDNASGEGKNQTVMKFCAWLVWRGMFETVTMTQFRVGHTHNVQDQRFAVVGGALNAQRVLED